MILNFNFHYCMTIEWTKGTRTVGKMENLMENSSSEVSMNFKLRLPRKELIDHM